jgi:hypothetical protein
LARAGQIEQSIGQRHACGRGYDFQPASALFELPALIKKFRPVFWEISADGLDQDIAAVGFDSINRQAFGIAIAAKPIGVDLHHGIGAFTAIIVLRLTKFGTDCFARLTPRPDIPWAIR